MSSVYVLTDDPCCCCGQSRPVGVVDSEEAAKAWVASEPGTRAWRYYEEFKLNDLPT